MRAGRGSPCAVLLPFQMPRHLLSPLGPLLRTCSRCHSLPVGPHSLPCPKNKKLPATCRSDRCEKQKISRRVSLTRLFPARRYARSPSSFAVKSSLLPAQLDCAVVCLVSPASTHGRPDYILLLCRSRQKKARKSGRYPRLTQHVRPNSTATPKPRGHTQQQERRYHFLRAGQPCTRQKDLSPTPFVAL